METPNNKPLPPIEQISRWLALIEAVDWAYNFAEAQKINRFDLKPSAINKYVEERVATISKDLELEAAEDTTKELLQTLQIT